MRRHLVLLSCVALATLIASAAAPVPVRATSDGTWTTIADDSTSPRGRTYHSFALDTSRQRLMIFGGVVASAGGLTLLNDVWAYSLGTPEGWIQIQAAGTAPSPREGAAMIYDPVRDRLLLFGGYVTDGLSEFWLNDLWELTLSGTPQWTQLTAVGAPSPRSLAAFTYDSVDDRCILFGGSSPSPLGDTWQLTLSGTPSWSPLFLSGSPPFRYETAAAYDPVHGAMLMFGGQGSSGELRDTWALTLGANPAWHQVPVVGARPSARSQARAVYDTANSSFVIFGGSTILTGGTFFNDAWALSLSRRSRWVQLPPGGDAPAPRAATAIAYDAAGSRIVIFGGVSYDGIVYTNFPDTWSLSTASGQWTLLDSGIATARPPGREYHAAALDPVRHRMIMFGGVNLFGGLHLWNDTWSLGLDAPEYWTNLQPAGPLPATREGHLMVYDSLRDRMIVFGGYNLPVWLNDVWTLSLSGTPTWSQMLPAGQQPGPRSLVAGFYDAPRDRVLLFGGSFDVSAYNDVYELSLAGSPQWSKLAPAGTPPSPRYASTAVFDAVRDRMIVFGGINGNVSYNDTWALELGRPSLQWTPLSPSGAPSPRSQCGGVVDTARDRMLLFAGSSHLTADTFYNDVFALPLDDPSAWTQLAPAGTAPTARAWPVCVYDAPGDRVIAFGGVRLDGSVYTDFGDTWSLAFADAATAARRGAPSLPIVHTADRALALRATIGSPREVALTTASPETPVTASLFDARGRRVWSRVVEGTATSIALPRTLAPGVYVVRAEQGARRAFTRVVIAR